MLNLNGKPLTIALNQVSFFYLTKFDIFLYSEHYIHNIGKDKG